MTTPRSRRSKPHQARDILLALLKDQEAEVAKHKAAYEGANLRATSTRRAIELLDQAMLPGMEPELPIGPGPSAPPWPMGVGARETPSPPPTGYVERPAIIMEAPTVHASVTTSPEGEPPVVIVTAPAPRRRRLDEKAQHISDVWNVKEGSVTVHSALMYSRQKSCDLCLAGVPFATEKRTEHYTVIRDTEGMERGFAYQPCTGIAEGSHLQ